MSSLATPPIPPHFHEHQRLSPTRSSMASLCYRLSNTTSVPSSNPRKRKASPTSEDDHEMSLSSSPQISHARLPPSHRKRARPNLTGRPLTVDRLLETLDRDSLRSVLQTLAARNPQLGDEIMQAAPRPSVTSTLEVLQKYLDRLRSAFPLDPNPRSEYSFDRVRPQWNDLLDALTDFTPHFLPPNESQSVNSLQYLDGVTQIIHELPEWDTPQHNLAKQNAYEEIARAWATVIKEAAKRGGGIHLQYGDWEVKLSVHNQKSGGLMQEAYDALATSLGWLRPQNGNAFSSNMQARQDVRNQLFSGNYGGMDQSLQSTNMRTGNGQW